jgi:replicative DNA helicase
MGKSALVLRISAHVAEHGSVVLFFSLEMSEEVLRLRLLSLESRIEYERLRAGFVYEHEWEPQDEAGKRIEQMNLGIEAGSDYTVLDMKAIARRTLRERGRLDLIIVDYLQLV